MTAKDNMLAVEYLPLESLTPYARNSRTHSDEQVAQIAGSIKEFGFVNPILIDGEGGIIAGHGRLAAAQRLKLKQVPTIRLEGLTKAQQRALVIADNKLALNAGWDFDMLAVELDELRDEDFDLSLLGFSQQELNDLIGTPNLGPEEGGEGEGQPGSLADRFMITPFSVLNAREGWWQDRKRAWLSIGIRSEEGRGDNLLKFSERAQLSRKVVKATSCGTDWMKRGPKGEDGEEKTGTSIFDPVLCELAYRWFSPPGGTILDPFAGGSVRGIVAAKLGRQYVGCDLRPEQVEANRAQVDILSESDPVPVWHCGDSRNIDKHAKGVKADFVFSCPPYADLEVYSDDPADLSTLGYPEFRDAYFEIIAKACSLLKPNRFAAFVVGDVRDKKGAYYNFVGDTVEAFRAAGLDYYNEAILVTAVGSLPIRVGRAFSSTRKLGKTHQNVLVFCKGDPRKAVEACGEVEVSDECFSAYVEPTEGEETEESSAVA